MKAKLLCIMTALLMVFTTAAFAGGKFSRWGCEGWFNKKYFPPQATVYLIEKDPAAAYAPVIGGANGTLEYNPWGPKFRFDFDGKGLEPGVNYTLIYYPDPWPGAGLICLGSDTANPWGRVDINGNKVVGNLPNSPDANAVTYPPGGVTGAKIWLVPSSDVYCGDGIDPLSSKLTGWNPTEILFESAAITYFQTP